MNDQTKTHYRIEKLLGIMCTPTANGSAVVTFIGQELGGTIVLSPTNREVLKLLLAQPTPEAQATPATEFTNRPSSN